MNAIEHLKAIANTTKVVACPACDHKHEYRRRDHREDQFWICSECGHIYMVLPGGICRNMTQAEKVEMREINRARNDEGRSLQGRIVERMIG